MFRGPQITGWQMLGNDVADDCNAVTWANTRRLVTATLTTEYYPTQAQVWQFCLPSRGDSVSGPPGSSRLSRPPAGCAPSSPVSWRLRTGAVG